MTFTQVTFGIGANMDPAISRDGRLLAYSSDHDGRGPKQIWVRPLQSGEAVQLTHHESNHIRPDFSPDGSMVAYRSFQDGGAIYVTPVAGGAERKIADGGFSPRYSPDGLWIAFNRIEESGATKVYVVPANGGQPRGVSEGTANAGCAVWSSGGTHLLFRAGEIQGPGYDFWVVRLSHDGTPDPKSLTKTGVSEALQKQQLPSLHPHSCPADWLGEQLTFLIDQQLWRVPISRETWKAAGPAAQLLPGLLAPHSRAARAIPIQGGKILLVSTVGAWRSNIWSLPMNTKRAVPLGELQQVSTDASIRGGFEGTRASLSADGKRLLFDSSRSGHQNFWLKDLTTGQEVAITASPHPKESGRISPDGSKVAYSVLEGHNRSIYISEWENRRERKVCGNCGFLKDWSTDGKRLLTAHGQTLYSVDVLSGSHKPLLNDSAYYPKEALFSPDGKWIALVTGVKGKKNLHGYLIPIEDRVPDETGWVPVTTEPYNLSLHWSPDGDLLYYFQLRDGFRCLWAQPLHPATKKLLRPAFVVRHFHSSQRYPDNGSWIAVARDRLAMTLTDLQSNIWMTELSP